MSMGLNNNILSKIKLELDRWNSQIEEDDCLEYNWVLYEHWFWVKIASEVYWDPLTLSLYYFKYLSKKKVVN